MSAIETHQELAAQSAAIAPQTTLEAAIMATRTAVADRAKQVYLELAEHIDWGEMADRVLASDYSGVEDGEMAEAVEMELCRDLAEESWLAEQVTAGLDGRY